ncbi:MAG TPA: hypothetical protein VGF71_00350 [Caulobacteraceae bacterium]|jgi:hypothetical protein
MTDSSPPSGRFPNGRFGPGNAGRPPGARNRVSRQLLVEIHKDFEAHKEELLGRLRSSYTPSYFSTLARLMPHMAQTETPGFDDYSDEEAARLVRRLREMFAVTTEPRTALAELETILASEPAADGVSPC